MSKGAAQAGGAIDLARQLETALAAAGATGKGLHEKTSSIEARLPAALVKQLRFVASVRNRIVHEDDVLPDDEFSAFAEAGKAAIAELGTVMAGGKGGKARSKAKPRKRAPSPGPDPDAAAGEDAMARAGRAIRLAGFAFLGGVALVFLLMVLGSDGPGLWVGAFVVYFVLGWLVLHLSRRAEP